MSDIYLQPFSRKMIKSHKGNCRSVFLSSLRNPSMMWASGCYAPGWNYRAALWYKPQKLAQVASRNFTLHFPGILWSLPFPAAKPYVVLVFSKFSGTGLPFQLGFMFHFILSRWCYHLSQIYFCNLCYIPQH